MTRPTMVERAQQLVAKMPPISDGQARAAAHILASVEPSAEASSCDHVLMRPGCVSCESRFQARPERASA